MTWNYRLILHKEAKTGEEWIGLHEVYYDKNGKPHSWTINPISFVCDAEEGPENGIVRALEMALSGARDKPMLIESELMADWAN